MKPNGTNLTAPRVKSFTLVEMLVVITIIAVLAALLLPALATAKDRAKTVACANNQKQLSGAFATYLNDNNGFYPYIYPECWVDNSPNGAAYSCTSPDRLAGACGGSCGNGAYCYKSFAWNIMLATYFGYDTNCFANWSFRTFCGQGGPFCSACNYDPNIQRTVTAYAPKVQCPSTPWPIPVYCTPGYVSQPGITGNIQPTWRMLATSYAMNINMFPWSFRGVNGASACTNNVGWYKRVNSADIGHPSSVALLGEIPWCVWAAPTPPNVWGLATLPGAYSLSASVVSNAGVAYQWKRPTTYTYCNAYAAAWHGEAMNVLYPDGHVEQVKQTDLLTYSSQYTKGAGVDGSPGAIFWGDNKAGTWSKDQFPGYSYPN